VIPSPSRATIIDTRQSPTRYPRTLPQYRVHYRPTGVPIHAGYAARVDALEAPAAIAFRPAERLPSRRFPQPSIPTNDAVSGTARTSSPPTRRTLRTAELPPPERALPPECHLSGVCVVRMRLAGLHGCSMSPRNPCPVPMGVMRRRTTTRTPLVRNALAPPLVERQTYTVEEAAQLLGISRSTAYECVRDGSLAALRFRKRVVIVRATVDALMEGVETAPSRQKGASTGEPNS
jgi:excisionase family DNA binding protein